MGEMRLLATFAASLIALSGCGGSADDDDSSAPSGYARLEGTHPFSTVATLVPGAVAQARAGVALAAVGDVDGDGLDDVLVGAPGTDDDAGAVLLLRGGAGGFVLGGRVSGAPAGARLGAALSGVGDLDGDGLPEVLVGAAGAGEVDDQQGDTSTGLAQGRVYVLSGPWASGRELSDATVATWTGGPAEAAGWSVASVPDVDDDGVPDLLIGAPGVGSYRAFHEHVQAHMLFDGPGAAYLASGATLGEVDLTTSSLARFDGEELWERAGRAVAGLPDGDGDGAGDVAIGAPDYYGAIWINPEATARVYVASGSARGDVALAQDARATLSGGCCGAEIHEELGGALAAGPAGRLFVGAPGLQDFGLQGGGFLLPPALEGDVDPWEEGAVVVGPPQESISTRAGAAVAAGFDLDCDGVDDAALGAPDEQVSGPRGGALFVAYGPLVAWNDLGLSGLHLYGSSSEEAGTSVTAADLDGDGCDEVVVGAPINPVGGTNAGGVWVVQTPRAE